MKRPRTLLILPLLAFIALDAEAGERPHHDAWLSTAAPATLAPAQADLGVYIASTEPSRGAPALVILPANASSRGTGSALAAARRHLLSLRHLYKSGSSAIRGARHRFTHDTGRGAVIVVLQQTVSGVDVFHGEIKVLLDRDQRVRAIAGSPHPAAHAGSARPFALDADRAISLALADLYPELAETLPLRHVSTAPGGWHRYDLSASQGGLHFRRPAR
ncbi:MAG TPA: hypothetical protein ENK31_02515, partial [Nannocystis exedens]|nr:hypothetical protein [Nannocystis exedens]